MREKKKTIKCFCFSFSQRNCLKNPTLASYVNHDILRLFMNVRSIQSMCYGDFVFYFQCNYFIYCNFIFSFSCTALLIKRTSFISDISIPHRFLICSCFTFHFRRNQLSNLLQLVCIIPRTIHLFRFTVCMLILFRMIIKEKRTRTLLIQNISCLTYLYILSMKI